MDNDMFVDRLAGASGMDSGRAARMVGLLGETIAAVAAGGDSAAVPGFGTFAPEKSDERVGVDASTGRRMLYPPEVRLVFKPSVILRNKLG